MSERPTPMDPTVRSRFAEQILDNPLFKLVESEMDSDYFARWDGSADPQEREKIWHEREAMRRFFATFRSAVRGRPAKDAV